MRGGLEMVEQSLLEADVSYQVVQEFMGTVTEHALGEKVLLSLNPDEQLVGIVNQTLIETLGPVDNSLPTGQDVNIYMMCGLQGSGKNDDLWQVGPIIEERGHYPASLCSGSSAARRHRPIACNR